MCLSLAVALAGIGRAVGVRGLRFASGGGCIPAGVATITTARRPLTLRDDEGDLGILALLAGGTLRDDTAGLDFIAVLAVACIDVGETGRV